MLGSRQPSALGRGGRAAPAPDVSRGIPARRWGQGAALTKQARDRTRYLLALALQPGRLLHASRTAPRERGQLKGESQRGGRLALGQASAIYIPLLQHINGASVSRAGQAPGIMQTETLGSHHLRTRVHGIPGSRFGGAHTTVQGARAAQRALQRPVRARTPELRTEVCVFWVSHAPSRACIPRNAQLKSQ